MKNVNAPTKEQVRDYMNARQHAHVPPPSPAEVRQQLGWQLIEAARRAQRSR